MCGIAGLYNPLPAISSIEEATDAVQDMTRALTHRGPDDKGIWIDPRGRCVLGNRRLSVIDLSKAGHQPMPSFDGRWVIAFNGEIYNFEELKSLLTNQGVNFRGHSDTEVLVNSIALWNTGALDKFDGMFAFAAFDTLSGELLVARDPFGEKPLYYIELTGGGLAFASELHALEKLPNFEGEMCLNAMAELLMFEYIGAPRSIYQSVKKLSPGCWLRATPNKPLRIERYFEFHPGQEKYDTRPIEEMADELEDILVRNLRRRVISDVPLGAFLSGGIDSSTVCALIKNKLGHPLKTFSSGFSGAVESEHETAHRFANHLGVEHHVQMITPDNMRLLSELGHFLDEPCSDWSCLPVYMLSKFARQHVTVAMSGDGGDEMFGGYNRYAEMFEKEQTESQAPKAQWKAGEAYYNWGLLALNEKAITEYFGCVPAELGAHLHRLRDEVSCLSPNLISRMRKSDVDNYLPGSVLAKVDRMSMQHSLEIRTPFLSTELARFAERLPRSALNDAGKGKRILREVAYRYLPKNLVDRPKTGFGLPNMDWARNEIREVARHMLGSDDSRLREFFGGDLMDLLLSRPRATHRWWAMAMLESWCRHHPAKLPEIPRNALAAEL